MAQILIYGASIAYGAWDMEKGGWVGRLRSFLEQKEKDAHFVYNLGIPGDSSAMLLKRFNSETIARIDKGEDSIFIFSIGINDSAYLKKENRLMVSSQEFKKNLSKLFGQAHKYTKSLVFVGLNFVDEAKVSPVPWNKNVFYSNKNIEEYNEIIKTICLEKKVLFIEMASKFSRADLDDGLHPNTDGHEKMFEIIKDELVKNKII